MSDYLTNLDIGKLDFIDCSRVIGSRIRFLTRIVGVVLIARCLLYLYIFSEQQERDTSRAQYFYNRKDA